MWKRMWERMWEFSLCERVTGGEVRYPELREDIEEMIVAAVTVYMMMLRISCARVTQLIDGSLRVGYRIWI
jgi:hypothetical protein